MTETQKKNTLKTAGCALAVITVVGIALITLSILFYPKDNRKSFGMVDTAANGIMGERSNSIDVVFIGDSEAYSSISPMQMWKKRGFTSYVCATSGQQLPHSNTLLHRATLDQSPRIVVIETNAIYRKFSPANSLFRTLQDVLPIFEYHDRWKSLSLEDFTTNIMTTYSHSLKGFRIKKDVKAARPSGHMAPSGRVQKIRLLNKLYLQLMIDHCRSIGAEPLLVSTPSTINWNTARHNGIKAFAKEMGVKYLDLNTMPTKVDIDWSTDTRDGGDHLNLSGATKVSDYLSDHLARFYKLPDHRHDAAYAKWNRLLKRYEKRILE